MDDPLTLCLLHCVGQAGNEEQQRQRVAIQSEAFLALPCICVHQIAALHLVSKMMIAAEALNEGGLFVFNKLSMKERQKHKEPEKREREHLCVFLPLLLLEYKNA